MLTTFDTDANIVDAIEAGADGFLLKDATPSVIVDAICDVAHGRMALSPEVLRRLADRTARHAAIGRDAANKLDQLTAREREVVNAIGRGEPNATIASELHMSVPTVKGHVSSALDTLHLGNRTQLAILAIHATLT